MQKALLAWYKAHGRHDLPWRNTRDAYHIYLSEIMLQQTQVKTVLERFYFPFLKRFPTLQSIAEAKLDDVLKMWEGLGYYTRARNLHHTALTCKGILPCSPQELGGLKGIGKSTAHAICAFAYHQALPILDANVKRVLCRFFGLSTRDEKVLWNKAWELLDSAHPYEYNQAMMDLGSMICTSKKPLCSLCPLHVRCLGRKNPENYPLPIKKAKVPTKKRFALIIEKEEKIALMQRQERLLHGLWGFVQVDALPSDAIIIGKVQHTYSHFKIELDVVKTSLHVKVDGWFLLKDLNTLALSSVDKKIAAILQKELKKQKNDSK